jgi:TetR/AcrR family transcriptional repressor of mexJK operon
MAPPKLPPSFSFADFVPREFAGDDKRSVILRAARKLFLRDGFSATSMDAVTSEAGVSKATVYAHFSSKQKLYEVLVAEGSENALSNLPPLARRGGVVADELRGFFEPLLTILFQFGGFAFDRMVASDSTRHPENAKFFYDHTIARITQSLVTYIDDLVREREVEVADVRAAADGLLAVVLVAPLHKALLLGPGSVDYRASLDFGLEMFLKMNGIPKAKPRAKPSRS